MYFVILYFKTFAIHDVTLKVTQGHWQWHYLLRRKQLWTKCSSDPFREVVQWVAWRRCGVNVRQDEWQVRPHHHTLAYNVGTTHTPSLLHRALWTLPWSSPTDIDTSFTYPRRFLSNYYQDLLLLSKHFTSNHHSLNPFSHLATARASDSSSQLDYARVISTPITIF